MAIFLRAQGVRRFALHRALQAVAVTVTVAVVAFLLVHFAPGDPFSLSLGDPGITDAWRAQQRALFGLDQPLPSQLWHLASGYLRGDFGWSIRHARPVADVLRQALPNTVLLMGTGLTLGLVSGVALGTWQAARRGTVGERLSGALALAVVSVPEFLIAIGAIALVARHLHWLPASGLIDQRAHYSLGAAGRVGDVLTHLALPALVIATTVAAAVSRYHRAAMLAVLEQDYIRTARAKGLTEWPVIVRHALPNALASVLALTGLLLPALFGGAIVVEQFFDWPGMGRLMFDAALGRDYPLIVGGVVLAGALVAVGSAVTDVLAHTLNPRLELDA